MRGTAAATTLTALAGLAFACGETKRADAPPPAPTSSRSDAPTPAPTPAPSTSPAAPSQAPPGLRLSKEGQMCGGIAGIRCAEGLTCSMPSPPIPDQTGVCKKP